MKDDLPNVHRPVRRHFTVLAPLVFVVAALLLSACGESTEKPSQTAAHQTSESIQFERIPDDKLDPALRRYIGGIDPQASWTRQPEIRKAFYAALAGKNVEKWVSELNIVTGAGEAYYTPDGVAFLYSGNKPHEGGIKQLSIAFLPASKQLRLRIDEKCKETKYFGSFKSSLVNLLQWADFPCNRNEKKGES